MKQYMTHNGPKTMIQMRHDLWKASGDIHWGNPFFKDKTDRHVIEKYVELDPKGYVVEM